MTLKRLNQFKKLDGRQRNHAHIRPTLVKYSLFDKVSQSFYLSRNTMFKCKSCDNQVNDGVRCTACKGQYDFPCAGITETGWRKLEDRKLTWRCNSCKALAASPRVGSSMGTDLESVLSELKRLSVQMESLPVLMEDLRQINKELADLKSMRADFTDVTKSIAEMRESLEFVHGSVRDLTSKVSGLEQEIDSLKKSKDNIVTLQERCRSLELQCRDNEQRSRMNNIEIKGVPESNSENLFDVIARIGEVIKCPIPKDRINYVARIPTRNNSHSKTIICSVHSCYLKNDFVAAARKHKILSAADLGLRSDQKIYINDHLTLDNKAVLNRTKILAKEKGYEYVWVTGCKIYIRKNHSSPKHHIRTEQDLKKFF